MNQLLIKRAFKILDLTAIVLIKIIATISNLRRRKRLKNRVKKSINRSKESSNQGKLRISSNIELGITDENASCASILQKSIQAGDAIIEFSNFKLNKEAKKFRVQNVNEIDLKSNSDISSLLKSSIRSKPQNLLRKKKTDHLTKVHIFEQEFQKSPRIDDLEYERVNANQTVENRTTGHYLAQKYVCGKAQRVVNMPLSQDASDSPQQKGRKIRTLAGVEVSTSSITVTDNGKFMPKVRATKVQFQLQ